MHGQLLYGNVKSSYRQKIGKDKKLTTSVRLMTKDIFFCFNPFEAVHPLGAGSCARQCLRRLPASETESPTKSANSHKCFNFQQGKTVPYSFFY